MVIYMSTYFESAKLGKMRVDSHTVIQNVAIPFASICQITKACKSRRQV